VLESLKDLPLPYAEEMSIETLFDIEDCPRQRDTAKRAAKAKHLDNLYPTHTVVSIAEFPDGRRMKLDCHTRMHKWASGAVPMPARILAIIFPVNNEAQAMAYYTHFDNIVATESSTDKICGAIKQHAINVSSPFLGDGRLGTPMRYVHRALRLTGLYELPDQKSAEFMYTMVATLAPQITALDSTEPKANKFRGPLATAFILGHLKHGDAILPFFKAANDNAGSEEDGKFCPFQGIKKVFSNNSGGGQSEHMVRVGKVLRLLESWLKGKRGNCYSRLPSALEAYAYLENNGDTDNEDTDSDE
jgi:hypothetical protein